MEYWINPTGYPAQSWDPNFDEIQRAFKKWETVTWGQIRFVYRGTTDHGIRCDDHQNTIVFDDPDGKLGSGFYAETYPWSGCPESGDVCIPFTVNGTQFCELVDADILFNNDGLLSGFRWDKPEDAGCSSLSLDHVDIETVATHEIGHLLGLDHSDPPATMAGGDRMPPCDRRAATLEADDIAGARFIYPPPGNAAYRKRYSVATSVNYEATEHSGGEITDGSLAYDASATDNCAGWRNNDYNQPMEVRITIDLGEECRVTKIRYNMGDVQRAESWGADIMLTPFGQTATTPGTPYHGAWTEHAGNISTRNVQITLRKTRTTPTTDWLFVGELEVIATPIAGGSVIYDAIRGPNNLFADASAAVGMIDERRVSLGSGGSITLDLAASVRDRAGPDLVVYEAQWAESPPAMLVTEASSSNGDTLSEAFMAYGSADGSTWWPLGSGMGTTAIDFANAPQEVRDCGIRYVRVLDPGSDDSLSSSPGFDLDGLSLADSLVSDPLPVVQIDAGDIVIDGRPAWARAGDVVYLPFERNFEPNPFPAPRIGRLPVAGGPVTDLGLRGTNLVVSPDGARLAFCSNAGLVVHTLATGVSDTIWSRCGELSWSQDGSSIRVLVPGAIVSIPSAGGDTTGIPLAAGPEGIAGLTWSPDGRRFAYAGYRDGFPGPGCGGDPVPDSPHWKVYIRSFPDNVLQDSLELGEFTEMPQYSPTGGLLVCSAGRSYYPYDRDLWVVHTDGERDPVRITTWGRAGAGVEPVWRPDGRAVMFIRDYLGLSLVDQLEPLLVAVPRVTERTPPQIQMESNRPNPFTGSTTIDFETPRSGQVVALIHDVMGRRVRELVNGFKAAGRQRLVWDGRDSSGRRMGPGVYWVRVRLDSQTSAQRLVLVR